MSANLKIHYIVMDVYPGAHINNTIRDAIAISMEHQCDVKFEFMGNEYVVNYEEIFMGVAKQHD